MNKTINNIEENGMIYIEGIDMINEEIKMLKFHQKTYVIFDFKKINPVVSRLVASGGLDTSGNIRATPPLEVLTSTFAECQGFVNPEKPYFIVYDFGYYNDKNCYRDMIVMVSYVPDSLSFRHKIAFASNMSYILSKLDISQHVQIHEIDDFTYANIRSECARIQRK